MHARLAVAAAAASLIVAGCRTDSSTPAPRVEMPKEIAAASRPVVTAAPLADQIATTAPAAATQASATTRPVGSLKDQLEAILTRKSDTGARVSARFVDPETGEELFAYDAGRPMTPASNMKLTVTSAALDFFGPDHVLETQLVLVGQDLWLIGTGDPATGDEKIEKQHGRTQVSLFDDWTKELKAKGVTSLSGNLYYVDNAFEKQQVHPTWGDLTEDYAAPIGGLNLNGNCVDSIVTPTTQPGEKPTLQIIPPTTASIVVVNDSVNGDPQTVEINRAADQNLFTVTGSVKVKTQLDPKPVTDPGAFFADALRTHLAANGIAIAGATVRGEALPDSPTTPPVALAPAKTKFVDVLGRINKNSQNTFAEGIAKYLGRAYAQQADRDSKAIGSWANANRAIRAFLAKHDIDASAYNLADGSGLSREDRVTTKLISEILVAMYRHPYFETFRKSMTLAGVDGTTSKRFKDVPGRVYCKTGYISGVRSLSGYLKTDAGKLIVFSIIYNNIPGHGLPSTKAYEDLQDEAVKLAMKYPTLK